MRTSNMNDYLNSEQAASILGYTEQHVTRLIRLGQLQGQKIGRDWLIPAQSVDRFLVRRSNAKIPFAANARRAVERSSS